MQCSNRSCLTVKTNRAGEKITVTPSSKELLFYPPEVEATITGGTFLHTHLRFKTQLSPNPLNSRGKATALSPQSRVQVSWWTSQGVRDFSSPARCHQSFRMWRSPSLREELMHHSLLWPLMRWEHTGMRVGWKKQFKTWIIIIFQIEGENNNERHNVWNSYFASL